MKRVSKKNINIAISKVAENYFKASNAKGLSESTRQFLVGKWAVYREIAYLLAVQDPKSLEDIVSMSSHWVKLAGDVEAEATSHPMGQS